MSTEGRDKAGPTPSGPTVAGALPTAQRCPVPRLWRRLGAAAFLFFLIKGLLWLAVPALIAAGFLSRGN